MIRKIELADTLESGFRAKYNETIQEIINAGEVLENGNLRLKKFGGGFIDVSLLGLFYSKEQIDQKFQNGFTLPNAAESIRGVIQLATMDEVNAGDDDQKAVTPFKLKHSSLNSFKGVWVQPTGDDGYLLGSVVIYGYGIYLALTDTAAIPGSDSTKWRLIGGGNPKTTIPYTGDSVTINWQTDVAPGETGDTRTYAEKHGNKIGSIAGIYDAGAGVMTPFTPNFTYTINGTGGIDIITFTEVFGPVTII